MLRARVCVRVGFRGRVWLGVVDGAVVVGMPLKKEGKL